ncbi:MAG: hypothetical protein ACXWEY_03660 [Bacteroidia bacterium]
MKRTNIKHGDVVEIYLPNVEKFCHGKIIDPKQIKTAIDLPHFLLVNNDVFSQPTLTLETLNRELLLAPFYIVGGSAAVTKFGWRIISNEHVSESEEWIPDTKEGWPLFSNPPQRWGYKTKYSTKLIFSEWEKVKHLDNGVGKNIEVIPFLIEQELLKIEGKDIQIEYGIKNWLEQIIYDNYKQLPVYSKLPNELKGKAIQ